MAIPTCFNKKLQRYRRICSACVALPFLISSILPPKTSFAQIAAPTALNLPVPGAMVTPTSVFIPPFIKGLTIYPNNPLEFNFIVDTGESGITIDQPEFRSESRKLIKYFLAALTIPDEDMWVNLSPYEKDRIISAGFGQTEMGRDLLAQDYLLKQLMASLTYPEDELGKSFWDKVYAKARELYGTTKIPINTFNKIWIVPDKAVVYEIGNTAYVVKTHLKVMLEGDYLALKENMDNKKLGMDKLDANDKKQLSDVSSAIVKEVLLPEIEKEVNEGKTFANLRQIYNSMVLATWYKKNLKESLLGQVYVNKTKIKGVDLDDKTAKEKIYQQYLEAFKKGVYNYIKEDTDPITQKSIPRKYFSGGFDPQLEKVVSDGDDAKVTDTSQFSSEQERTSEEDFAGPEAKAKENRTVGQNKVVLVEVGKDGNADAAALAIDEGEQAKAQKPLNGVPREIQNILDEAGIDINDIAVQPGQENVPQVRDGILDRVSEDKENSDRKKVEQWLRNVMFLLDDEDIALSGIPVGKAGQKLEIVIMQRGGADFGHRGEYNDRARFHALFGGQQNHEYLQAIAQRINPDEKRKRTKVALYLFSGPDISTVLEATDAETVVLVDAMPFYTEGEVDTNSILRKKSEMGFYPVFSTEYAQSGMWPLMNEELSIMGAQIIDGPATDKDQPRYELKISYKGKERTIVYVNRTIKTEADLDAIKSYVLGVNFDFLILKAPISSNIALKSNLIITSNFTTKLLMDLMSEGAFIVSDRGWYLAGEDAYVLPMVDQVQPSQQMVNLQNRTSSFGYPNDAPWAFIFQRRATPSDESREFSYSDSPDERMEEGGIPQPSQPQQQQAKPFVAGEGGADQMDNASLTKVGGIDLNPRLLDLQIKRDGNGVPLPLPQQPIGTMNIQGFLPIIIDVSPVSIPLLLGFQNDDRPQDSASKKTAKENFLLTESRLWLNPKFWKQPKFLG